jgi:hypothetical protein
VVDCLPADADQFRRRGCLLCNGPLAEGAAGLGGPTRRRHVRRAPRGGTRVEVRPAGPDRGPNLAVALADVCEEGIGVWLTAPLGAGAEVEVVLAAATRRRAVVAAEVRWCASGADGGWRAGLRLRRPLTGRAVAELAG